MFRVIVWLLICAATVAGCAHRPEPVVGTDGNLVKQVTFEGTTRFSDGELLKHLYAGETKWVPLTPDYPFDEALLVADARRIEQLYAAHGYYEAQVVETEATPVEGKNRVDLRFVVREGPPTKVTAVTFSWGDAVPDDVRQRAEAKAAVKSGDTFEIPQYNASLGAIRQALLVDGHPLADVTGRPVVDRAGRNATVEFMVQPGPSASIGAVRFEGLHKVPEHLVAREVEFAQGEPYSPSRVLQMEGAVKALQVFRWVSTLPPTEVVDGKVDLVMRVSEADPHAIRLGLELAIDTVRWQQQGRLEYTHTNVFGNLTRLDLVSTAGWAELPNPFQNDLHGPVAAIVPKLTKKGLLERHLYWWLAPGARIDLDEGYQYFKINNRFGVSRWFEGFIRAELAHGVSYVDFFNLSPGLDANASILGRDFRDPYLLSSISPRLQLFLADSFTSPTNGAIIEAMYTWADEVIGSDYNFHRVHLGGRGYWRPWKRLQFASRLQTGIITTFGDAAGTPFDRRFYLGGSNSVRGWGSRRLSPRIEECDAEGTCDTVPVGGYTMVQANLEARVNVFGPVTLVGFFDMGDVQSDELTFETREWNYSAGPGLRVKTPMGTVRADVGFRLNDPGVYDDKMWAAYVGLGEVL